MKNPQPDTWLFILEIIPLEVDLAFSESGDAWQSKNRVRGRERE